VGKFADAGTTINIAPIIVSATRPAFTFPIPPEITSRLMLCKPDRLFNVKFLRSWPASSSRCEFSAENLDVEFAGILAHPSAEHPGFAVPRLSNQAQPAILRAVRTTVRLLEHEQLPGHLWVVDKTKIRIR